jgi:hypothetical protein
MKVSLLRTSRSRSLCSSAGCVSTMRKSAPRSAAWATLQTLWLLGPARRSPIPIRPALRTNRPASLPRMLYPPRSFRTGQKHLYSGQQTQCPAPILYVGRSGANRERKAPSVHQEVALAPFDFFVSVIAAWMSRFFDGLDYLGVHDGRRRLGILAYLFLATARTALRIRGHNPVNRNLLK